MEIDHIFIRARKGAPEAEKLIEFGLVEGEGNVHPGQGTSNRRFFFHNMMIELIWISDFEEVQSSLTRPMKLYDRLSAFDEKTSPFGICFRPCEKQIEHSLFDYWEYKPMYLPPNMSIEVEKKNLIEEPLWFFISFGACPADYPAERSQPLEHRIPFKEVSKTSILSNSFNHNSETSRIVNHIKNVEYMYGDENIIEFEFDGHKSGKSHDFRPDLPLIFRW